MAKYILLSFDDSDAADVFAQRFTDDVEETAHNQHCAIYARIHYLWDSLDVEKGHLPEWRLEGKREGEIR